MINDVAGSNGAGFHGTLVTGAPKEQENKELEVLQNQAASLAEIMSGSKDSVEISDQARALSEAAKTSSGEAGASAHTVDTPEDDIAESSAAATEKTLGTRKGRDALAADYNAVLKELRGQYGEAEAMRRFDAFMESEGYERVAEDRPGGMKASGGLHAALRALITGFKVDGIPPLGQKGSLYSNLSTSSSIVGAFSNGEVKYLAETYANYAAYANNEVRDALNGLYQKNLESAQSGTSIDLAAYMEKNFSSNPQISAVSVSTELGSIAAKLLEAAGVELGEGGFASFSLKEDNSGLYISGVFEDSEAVQKAIDSVLQQNPDMLQAFTHEYNRVALSDTTDLAGAYDDGMHSIEYGQAQRSFIYAASEPSAVVMTDAVGVRVTGYNYQKKVSDSFDTDADYHRVSDGGVSLVSRDFENHEIVNRQLGEDIRRAIETGEEIESTMTKEEHEAIQAERSAGFVDAETMAASAKLYSVDQGAEQEAKAAETRQALLDLDADPRFRNMEISYVNDQQEARKATVSQLLELFRPGQKTPGLGMINSIMESLFSMNAIR